jgi:hypothetical protein
MRLIIGIIVAAAILGVGLGVGLTWAELGSLSQPPKGLGIDEPPPIDRPLPRVVVVDSDLHDFGTMERDATRSHTFEIRNEGDAPLKLIERSTSCKCTTSLLDDGLVMPGKTATVTLEWKAVTEADDFRQTATIETNDPRRQFLTLTIHGRVTHSHKVAPEELAFTRVQASDGAQQDLYIYSYGAADVAVIDHEFIEKGNADYFALEVSPMPVDLLKKEDNAKGGLIARVVLKPGLPLGPLHQTIRLRLNVPGEPAIEVPIAGEVFGDVTVMGPRSQWNDELQILSLGTIKSDVGAKSRGMYLLVKAEDREQLNLQVREIMPPFLKCQFDEPREMAERGLLRIPFTVEVPKGAPIADHSGTIRGSAGHIQIETGIPGSPRLQLIVKFRVEK